MYSHIYEYMYKYREKKTLIQVLKRTLIGAVFCRLGVGGVGRRSPRLKHCASE